MPRLGWTFACAALVSCTPAAPGGNASAPLGTAAPVATVDALDPEVDATPGASASASADASDEAANVAMYRKEELPPAIALPTRIACQLKAQQPTRRITLRLHAGGAPIGTLNKPPNMTMTLPVGAMTEGAVVDAADDLVSVRAAVNGPDIQLSAARALVLAGYAIPTPSASLRWLSGHADGAPLQIELADIVQEHVSLRRPAIERVGCADVSLTRGSFKVEQAVPNAAQQTFGELAATHIDIRDTPRGEIVAMLELASPRTEGKREALIYQRRNGAARISYRAHDVLVFGWIAGGLVKQVPTSLGPISSFGTGSGSGWGGGHWTTVVCPHALPLLGRADGQSATLGRIEQGVVIRHRLPISGDSVDALLPGLSWLRPHTAGAFGVPSAALNGCTAATP